MPKKERNRGDNVKMCFMAHKNRINSKFRSVKCTYEVKNVGQHSIRPETVLSCFLYLHCLTHKQRRSEGWMLLGILAWRRDLLYYSYGQMFSVCRAGYYAKIVLSSCRAEGWKSKGEINAFDSQMKQPFVRRLTYFFFFLVAFITGLQWSAIYFASLTAAIQLFPFKVDNSQADQRQFKVYTVDTCMLSLEAECVHFSIALATPFPLEGAKEMENRLHFRSFLHLSAVRMWTKSL